MVTTSAFSLRRWLLICCGMIYAMAIIGAITRLTESGLSIVEWKPITGALPPLNAEAWQRAFTAYQQIPQYKLLKLGMTMPEFQNIYFWEWLHRLWGRLIGIVYALPFFWFLFKKQIPQSFILKLWIGLLLGGLQGAVGWFMVASGLSQLVYVSHYRLALHLTLALAIYAYLFWLALTLSPRQKSTITPSVYCHGGIALGLLTITIIWGAFVAGLKAGWVYNSFPLMDGSLVPDAAWTMQPLWQNFFANTALVQFCHRLLAISTGAVLWAWCWRIRNNNPHLSVAALALMVAVQIILGITTLLTQVNIVLATLHQAGAILLLSLTLYNLHNLQCKKQ